MATDIQIAYPSEVVRLSRIRFTPTSPLGLPSSLDIVGEDFRSVDQVLINDIESPDVIVLSATRLLAQLPDALQRTRGVNSVLVTSRRLTVTPRSIIRFRFSDTPGRATGIVRLMQYFLKILLGTPGRDIFSKNLGGGALRNLGATYGADEGKGVISDFYVSVESTSRQIVALQGRNPRIPRDERLLSARVSGANFNKEQGAILATIELTSQAGRSATTNLEL